MTRHALIAGGGIAGPALALFLNKAGIASTVYEAYPEMDDIGGGLQIAPNGMHVLDRLGIAKEIIFQGVESEQFSFENQHGKVLGIIANGPAARYGMPAVMIARSAVHRALLSEAERCGIPIHYGKRLQRFTCESSGVVAEFDDGTAAEGSLLIGADGIHSRTRELLFPEGPRPVYTGLFTIGGFASHPGLVPASPKEMRRTHLIFGKDGFFGYGYFDRRNPNTVMWWSHLPRPWDDKSKEYKSWPTEELRRELLERHRDWPDPVATILQSATELLRGPVHDVPSLPAWSKGRVLLIGDAAHAISPHAGQGASLALEDAMTLGKLLRNPQTAHERAFELFEQQRRNRVERIVTEARRRGDRKQSLSPGEAWVRDRVISVLARVLGSRMHDWMYSYKIAWEG